MALANNVDFICRICLTSNLTETDCISLVSRVKFPNQMLLKDMLETLMPEMVSF